ncbi:MAG: NAD(P)H-hydrate dehydratase [Acidimicrobiales bacterium]
MRELDSRAIEAGIPYEVLVERAGRAVAVEAMSLLGRRYGRRVIVVAGPGSNGADGRVAASVLSRRGVKTIVIDVNEVPDRLPPADLVIDAAFGTGFRDEYQAPDPCGARVLAVDLPTGIDVDTGVAGPRAVTAEATVTFGALKPGLLLGEGRRRAGRVVLRRIGLPLPAVGQYMAELAEDTDIAELVPARQLEAHKWQTALAVVAGSPGMYGAPSFVSRAASRAGAGMVRLGVPGAEPRSLPVSEAVARVLPATGFDEGALDGLERCKALVVGPGLGTERTTQASVRRLLAKAPVPVVIDADALTALGDVTSAGEIIGARGSLTVLTPHEGEYARLTGSPPGPDRVEAVRRLARTTGAIVALKGSTTVVASPDGRVIFSTSGTARLATAGTGDVLSGIIGAFLARGMDPLVAAGLGAHVHGRAAERGYAEGLTAGDLPDLVAAVLSDARTGTGGTSAC